MSKYFWVFFLLLASSSLFMAQSRAETPVVNGDFSEDLSGWRFQANDPNDATCQIENGAMKMSRKKDGYYLRTYQDVAVTADRAYEITFRLKVQGAGSGQGWIILHTTADGGRWLTANDEVRRSKLVKDTDGQWQTVTMHVPAVEGMDKLRLNFAPHGTDTTVWIDDVVLKAVDQQQSDQPGSEPVATMATFKEAGFFGPADQEHSMEDIARNERPYDGRHLWSDYSQLLNELVKERYLVLPMNQFATDTTMDKVVVGMRHDIDSHPEKALVMANLEEEAGIRSTYYLLHSARYYGTVKDGVIIRHDAIDQMAQNLHQRGFEIGIHTDLFTVMWDYQFDPRAFIQEEIAYYRDLGIPVTGAAAHGNTRVLKKKLNNMWMFSDFGKVGVVEHDGRLYPYGNYRVADYGLSYEAYLLKKTFATGDIDPRIKNSQTPVHDLIAQLNRLQPGQRAIILTHPEHWGKTTTP